MGMDTDTPTVTGEGTAPRNGDVIFNSGYEFRVTEAAIETTPDGVKVFRYTGVCTDSSRNDSIRKTSYNGGRYGWEI
jgi:hypothetical protein